ncbi:MAG: TY-Chap domain-containing protein [Acidimicrobiales bacterium]
MGTDFDKLHEQVLAHFDPPESEDFVLALGAGGGPEPFAAALSRKFRRLVPLGSWCVILTPTLYPAPGRYVQALVSPAGVRVESVGEQYLHEPGAELTDSQLAALDTRGWIAPPGPDTDADWGWPYNWWYELSGPDCFESAAGMLVVALIEVHDLAADEPVEVTIFPTPDGQYRWEIDTALPCGGHLVHV